ncbi:protein VAC14 homolog isoform X2 [Zingiber officinale]|uniref:protein VAC14 homolog isoform X2 n=1 Tax=Zingiber officinale TaxID=94328 RepID=UPI001C4B74F6|nr:protein VAC14 homolog isoform X2 [Zingiber officinale]
MADALSLIPASVFRNLADKLYEKRKNAALEIEGIIKQLALSGEHDKISAVINLLISEFAGSPQANHRKGGLIGLAAVTVGLGTDAAQHLTVRLACYIFIIGIFFNWYMLHEHFANIFFRIISKQIVPPVLKSFADQDSRVRYHACEALYNIAKVVRGDFIVFFNKIFDALCKLSADSDPSVQSAAHLLDRLIKDIVTESDQFSIEEFIPLLRARMNVLNPYVRQFLVGWITVLDSVPDIDMLGFLPDFLDGLFNMLSDSSHEIRQQADSALSEFLQEIKNSPNVDYGRMAEILVQRAGSPDEFTRLTAITWINEFVKLGREQLVPYYAEILGAILPCISDREEKIRVVARETNEELRGMHADPTDGFNIDAILSIARRELTSEWEATRIEALQWISKLLVRHRNEVVLLVLEVHACIAEDPQHFCRLIELLVRRFQKDRALLERRGALVVRRLCVLLDAERVYREFSSNLEHETDLDFASIMVQALNLILLTSLELADLRALVKQSLVNSSGKDLFISLYSSWCHSPMATISLCLLAQAYNHASSVIQSLGEADINAKFLVQLDKLIRLLETPIFAYIRLQLLEPGKHTWLLKTLYCLLMLLPQQSAAFKLLRTRLKTVPLHTLGLDQLKRASSENPYSQILQVTEDGRTSYTVIDFQSKLQQFEQMQHRHRLHSRSQLKSLNASSSTISQEIQISEESHNSSSQPENIQPSQRSSLNIPGQLKT